MSKIRELDLATIRAYGNVELLARQLVEGFITGLHRSPFHGFSVEFAEHRLYNSGESTRYIDWKVYAKTDKVFVKRYEEETNLRCHLLVDTSSSMFYPSENNGKITFSTLAAGTLAYLMQKQRDAIGLTTFSDTIELQTQTKSTGSHVHQLFGHLTSLLQSENKNKGTSVAETLHLIADKIPRRSLVILFSDMFDDIENTEKLFSALQHLRHNKHEVLLFHVTDHATERKFAFEERPYEFIDLETGQKLKLQPSQVKQHYTTAIEQFYYDLKLRCGQYKIDFIETDINKGFDPIMTSFLAKRSKMR